MTQLVQQMTHYNPSWGLVKHFAYGCNCNMLVGDRPMSQPGFGNPLDDVDATCKNYRSCQECVTAKYGPSCVGEFTDYSWSTTSATCSDAPGTCARALCECDAQFAQAHSAKSDLYNQDFSHVFSMFDATNICRKYRFFFCHFDFFHFDIWPKFWIICPNFDYGPKFQYLPKITIFSYSNPIVILTQKLWFFFKICDFWPKL